MIQIAPSILAADFARLGDEIRAVEAAGADAIHIDVMDGHFVPNLTIGVPIVASIRKVTQLPFDVHLMVAHPEHFIAPFAKAGANWLSVHVETSDLAQLLPAIKALGCKAGAVLNPETPVERLLPYVALADYLLVMSVRPGFAGQKHLSECVDKVRALKAHLDRHGLSTPIQIDGGITLENVAAAKAAGATIIVAASAIFQGKDYRKVIAQLRDGT